MSQTETNVEMAKGHSGVVKTIARPTVVFYDPDNKKWTTVIEEVTDLTFPFSVSFEVTPDWAKDVLGNRNPDNRRIDHHRVKKYVSEIINGRWQINNDDICFSKDGVLLNGQHRLAAVIEAQRPVEMSFKFGLPSSIVPTIDEGKTRTNLDVIRIMKRKGSGKTLGCTNYMLESKGVKRHLPRQSQLDFHDRHCEAAEFACQVRRSPYGRNPVHAAIARAWYHADRDRLAKFVSILDSGIVENMQPGDVAAMRLRQYIDSTRLWHSGTARAILYRKTESAINHFVNGDDIKRLYEASEELFPLPEEKVE